MKVIDLFAGCGGFSLGFIKDGYDVINAVEFDVDIAQTYKLNHPNVNVIVDDIKNIDSSGLLKNKEADVIIGGPPCQGFSMAGARIRNGFIDDPRNYLFKHFFNIVKTVRPKVFIMENVKGILTMQKGKIFKEIQNIFQDSKMLEGSPYHLYYRVIKAIDFGIPQKRERMILIGTIIDNVNIDNLWDITIKQMKKEYPSYFDKVTVKDAIGNIVNTAENGEVINPRPVTNYQNYLKTSNDKLVNHNKTNHSKIAMDRMSRIANGQNFTVLDERINSVHSGSYGRLSWDEQAPTITTRFDTPAGGRFIHPSENRTLTPREAARIQSFSDDFIFYGNKTTVCKTIGNAVPPKISFFLAKLVRNIVDSE